MGRQSKKAEQMKPYGYRSESRDNSLSKSQMRQAPERQKLLKKWSIPIEPPGDENE